MKHISFNQLAVTIMITCLFLLIAYLSSFAQDTVYETTHKVPYNVLVDKSGNIKKVWYRKVKVDCGYTVKYSDGTYLINGRLMKDPENKKGRL